MPEAPPGSGGPLPRDAPGVSGREILAARPEKEPVDPWEPYAFHVEPERAAGGEVEPVATIFLTNRECPFRCLMCDLWKYTTDETVPEGAVPAQIDHALERLPPARHVKLYNSGNFFDPRAYPPSDRPAVAQRVAGFETVIVENHPRLCDEDVLAFAGRLPGELEVALGLETAHPEVLERLNKGITLDDFRRAVEFLGEHGVPSRAFVLLRPPYLDEAEGVEWALRSLEFAFDAGVRCCSVVPTRGGNGVMERLARQGFYAPPSLASMETVLEEGVRMARRRGGRVFVDLWDVERFFGCRRCGPGRARRLRRMNLTQEVPPPVACDCR